MPFPVTTERNKQLVDMLAGPAPAQPAGPPSATGMALRSATDMLASANPDALSNVLGQMTSDLSRIYFTASQRFPDAMKDISSANEALARAKKTIDKAAQVLKTTAPIVNSAGIGPTPVGNATSPIAALLGT